MTTNKEPSKKGKQSTCKQMWKLYGDVDQWVDWRGSWWLDWQCNILCRDADDNQETVMSKETSKDFRIKMFEILSLFYTDKLNYGQAMERIIELFENES